MPPLVFEVVSLAQGATMSTNKILKGVSGWLLLLTIIMTILGPLTRIGNFMSEFENTAGKFQLFSQNIQWMRYRQAALAIMLFAITISIASGWRLWRIYTPKSVIFAICALWIAGPISKLLVVASRLYIFEGMKFEPMLPELMASFITPTIWSLYLMRSIRVKNTYGFRA
jgi:hypothetical protein